LTGLTALGIDPASNPGVFLAITAYTFAVVTVIWVIGLVRRNHSIMDAYYGFGYVIPAVLAFTIADAQSQVAVVLLLMVCLHGLRLGCYLAKRMHGYLKRYGGDPRYNTAREKFSPGYWWKSFFLVMEPQAVLITLLGSPSVVGILYAREPNGQIGWLAVLGLAVFCIGLYFEAIADGQLQAFIEDKPYNQGPTGSGRYLNTGVWKHSRHPNYFGTTTVWWGIWIVAMSASTACWWTVIGPVVNTLMLTVLTGSRMTDQIMGSRPEYRELMNRTRFFFPIPVRADRFEPAASRLTGSVRRPE
jgi:steroid 5-alpha reductase family enzyme